MDSNEHCTMEQNEEHLEMNISIYYTHETELYAESYDAMNMSMYCKNLRTWSIFGGRSQPPEIWIGPSSSSPELEGARRPELGETGPAGEEGDDGRGAGGGAARARPEQGAGRRRRPQARGGGDDREAAAPANGGTGGGDGRRRAGAGAEETGRRGPNAGSRASAAARRTASTCRAVVGCGRRRLRPVRDGHVRRAEAIC